MGSTSSGWSLRAFQLVRIALYAWHGGEAWTASKPSSGYCHRISLVELKRIPGLRPAVHADDIESGPVVTRTRATGTAE
jgi:hypothetical protein